MHKRARIDLAREIAREMFSRTFIDPAAARASLINRAPSFEQVFNVKEKTHFEPNDAQRKVADLPKSASGSVTIVEAPTGSGKTEMAFQRYLALFGSGDVDGMYFALPTRTAATQIFNRLTDYTKRAYPDPDIRPPVTLAVPGYLAFDEVKGVRLSKFEVLWDDDEAQTRYRGWASEHSKRYLAGSIVVGTIDQVLLSRLSVKHAHMRATALLRLLLVIDEVHASDVYMTRLTKEVLDWQLRAGGHALLMSATLGGTVKHYYLQSGKRAVPPSLAECQAEQFPLITHKDRREPASLKLTPVMDRSADVSVDIRPIMLDPAQVASLAYQAASDGAHVLVIRNTVNECLKTQLCLEDNALPTGDHLFRCNDVPAPHHSRFAQADRTALDNAVEEHFGKERSARGVALVATQTVQQSLDLDADLLITDLCPMDVLLQRIGRLFRHLRGESERPPGFRFARVIVLVPDERDLTRYLNRSGKGYGPCGIGSVYADLCVLEATWRLLEKYEVLHLPAQCRDLVEGALHPEEVLGAIAEQLGELWTAHRNHIKGVELGQGRVAGMNLVNWKACFDEREILFPDDNRKLATRLGEGDRWVRFPEPFTGPFANPIDTLTLPAFQARGMPDETEPVKVELSEGATTFFLSDRRFVYDRLGLRPVQKPEDEDDVTP